MRKLSLLLGTVMILGTAAFAGDNTKACCKGKKEACAKEKVAACEKGKGCCKKEEGAKASAQVTTSEKTIKQSDVQVNKAQPSKKILAK